MKHLKKDYLTGLEADADPRHRGTLAIINHDVETVALIPPTGKVDWANNGNGPGQYAVARLFIAAPALLDACEAAEYWLQAELEKPGQATPDEILRVLRAAIAQTKGEA